MSKVRAVADLPARARVKGKRKVKAKVTKMIHHLGKIELNPTQRDPVWCHQPGRIRSMMIFLLSRMPGSKPEESKEASSKKGEQKEEDKGPPKDAESAETWAEVMKTAPRKRQGNQAAADKAIARTYPRPLCDPAAKPNCTYKRSEHVPARDAPMSNRWGTKKKPKEVQKRNPVQLIKDAVHRLNAPKQKPP